MLDGIWKTHTSKVMRNRKHCHLSNDILHKVYLSMFLKRATKSSKDLCVKPWGPSWMNSHICSKTLTLVFVNDICKNCFL